MIACNLIYSRLSSEIRLLFYYFFAYLFTRFALNECQKHYRVQGTILKSGFRRNTWFDYPVVAM